MVRTGKHPLRWFGACLALSILWSSSPAACRNTRPREGSYFPLAVGNHWIYTVRSHSQPTLKSIEWRVTQREIVNGKLVFHLWPRPAQGDESLSLSESEMGVVETGTSRILLKRPLRTGQRWRVASQSLRAPGKSDSFEVTSAAKACFVGGHSFNNCVIVREIDEANHVVSLTTYARRVGPVKYVYFKDLNSKEVDTTLIIKSWVVHQGAVGLNPGHSGAAGPVDKKRAVH
jgi:hypothetical protein